MCLSLDLGLMDTIVDAIEEHIKNLNQIDAEFIGTTVTHHIDKLVVSFAIPCTAHFAVQLSLIEFRAYGLITNTRVRFIAPSFR